MADQSIFTTEVPAGHNFFDNAPITLSTSFYTTVDTVVDAARWWASANPSSGGSYELVLFESTNEDVPAGAGEGIVLGTVTVSVGSVPADTWTAWQPFIAGMIRVRAYHVYKVGLRTALGSYTATSNAFLTTTVIGDFVTPQSNAFNSAIGGTYYNGSYTPDITNYPDQTFNATAYFVDARIPDLSGALTLVGLQHVEAQDASTLSVHITPDTGDKIVVKTQTWDWSISMSLADDASSQLTFTREIDGNASGFLPWVGIDTATCSTRPTSPITITSTPTGLSRHNMVIEIWRNAEIGAAVVATRGSTDLSTNLTATAGSQISWVGADSQSRDPANSTLVSGSVLEYTDDGHIGSNGVSYYGTHAVPADGATTFGAAGNVTPPSTVNNFSGKIAGIEILHSAGSGMTPVSVQLDLRWDVYQLASKQVDLRWDVYNSATRQLDLRWDVYNSLTKQLDLRWDVYQRATALLDLRWDVLQLVAKQLDLRWDVYQRIGHQLNLQWDVIGRVKKQLDLRWTVEAFGPALPTKPIVVNRRTSPLVINRTTGVDFTIERG